MPQPGLKKKQNNWPGLKSPQIRAELHQKITAAHCSFIKQEERMHVLGTILAVD